MIMKIVLTIIVMSPIIAFGCLIQIERRNKHG